MTTLTIPVSDETYRRLQAAAESRGATVPQFAAELLDAGAAAASPPGHPGMSFEDAVKYVLTKNEELNRRLAR
jgi:hypothetical protein